MVAHIEAFHLNKLLVPNVQIGYFNPAVLWIMGYTGAVSYRLHQSEIVSLSSGTQSLGLQGIDDYHGNWKVTSELSYGEKREQYLQHTIGHPTL